MEYSPKRINCMVMDTFLLIKIWLLVRTIYLFHVYYTWYLCLKSLENLVSCLRVISGSDILDSGRLPRLASVGYDNDFTMGLLNKLEVGVSGFSSLLPPHDLKKLSEQCGSMWRDRSGAQLLSDMYWVTQRGNTILAIDLTSALNFGNLKWHFVRWA